MENNDNHDGIVIRKVVANDIVPLANLYTEVWPELGLEYHLQKAKFVLQESSGVSYLAEKEGKIVGSRTSFFMPVYYGKRKLNCVQFADSCVHESCRGKGLFLRLNKAFLQDFFEEKGGELIYNISVDASRKAYEKLGWNYIKSLCLFQKYVRPFSILWKVKFDIRKIHGAVAYNQGTDIQEIDPTLLEIRTELLQQKEKIFVDYTNNNISWRLKSQNGIKVLNVPHVGSVIYKVGLKSSGIKVILIGDIFLYEYSMAQIREAEKALRSKEHPDIMQGYFTPGHPLYSLLRKSHFQGEGRFLNHGVRVNNKEMKTICYQSENWALSFLDIDTF